MRARQHHAETMSRTVGCVKADIARHCKYDTENSARNVRGCAHIILPTSSLARGSTASHSGRTRHRKEESDDGCLHNQQHFVKQPYRLVGSLSMSVDRLVEPDLTKLRIEHIASRRT